MKKRSDKYANYLLNWMRNLTKQHLRSKGANVFFSGYLTDHDIIEIENETGKKIHCSAESGEYFYKLN
jgi:hypothetical protein